MSAGNPQIGAHADTNPQLIGNSQHVTIDGLVSHRSTVLEVNRKYRIVATVDCFIIQGGATVDAATATSAFLPAGEVEEIFVDTLDRAYVAVISTGAVGFLDVHVL